MGEYPAIALMVMVVLGAVTTAILAVLVIYRATLSAREDDQLFIDAAEQRFSQEQQVIITKMSRLRVPIIEYAVITGVLALVVLGVLLA